MDEHARIRWTALRSASAAAVLLLALAAGCGSGEGGREPLRPVDWVNPDVGSIAEPLEVPIEALPYSGELTGGIHYLVVRGLPANMPYNVALTRKRADADLFVLGDPGFTDYRCSSQRGGAGDDTCTAEPFDGDALYVEVYGYTGSDTRFVLDVR